MQLFDTLSRTLHDVTPVDDVVTLYTCGPTVYDYPHIGNWYAFVRWDILNRALLVHGYTTKWVMNITDVGHLVSDDDDGEDKLEKGAKREGKTAWDVAKYYGDYFIEGTKRLNFSDVFMLPKATDHISEQIELVQKLEEKGFTYTIDDGVYFDTAKLEDYGKLAHLDINKLKAGARVEINPQKINITDFALWKFSPKDEQRDMEWESPWGKGFPGWHIECSAMSMKYLGETLSIHAGGIDHIPVHHTNEIAQSEAATGKPFANTWVHSNFILVDGKKMSKSLDNFYTLEDIQSKGYDLEVFRLLILESQYHTEATFSWDSLEAAKSRLQGLRYLAEVKYQAQDTIEEGYAYDCSQLIDFKKRILEASSSNLNTPAVLRVLNECLSSIANKKIHTNDIAVYEQFLSFVDALTGLQFTKVPDITKQQHSQIDAYIAAKQSADYTTSDRIRSELAGQGINISDLSKQTFKWARNLAEMNVAIKGSSTLKAILKK